MCLIGCISATNDTGVDNYKSIPTTSDIQQQDITPTTNTQNEIQTTNKAVESNKDPVASNVNENINIKMDVNTQTTNTNNTLKSNAKKTADSKTVKQAAQKDTTKVKVTDITSYPGKTVQLKAQITSSKTVNSGTVLFKINGITYGQTSVSNGIATMNYHISSSFKNPTYTITAIYQGNDKFSESRANGTLHLNNVTKTSVKV
ncbi:Ig-like domain-containing protein, partial [Methanosphaera cuniculi]